MDFIWNIPTIYDALSTIKKYFKAWRRQISRKEHGELHNLDLSTNKGCSTLWKGILGDKFFLPQNIFALSPPEAVEPIRPGHILRIKSARLTRWVPVLPGQMYSPAMGILEAKLRESADYVEEGGELEELVLEQNNIKMKSGVASYRCLPRNNTVLMAVSSDFTFLGIPCLVEQTLYEEFLQAPIERHGHAIANIEAIMIELPGEWNGALRENVPSQLLDEYFHPKFLLRLQTIKNVSDGAKALAAAWTAFQSGNNLEELISVPFELTSDDADLIRATDEVISYSEFLRGPLVGGPWTPTFNFDELVKRIPNTVLPPLESVTQDELLRMFRKFYFQARR